MAFLTRGCRLRVKRSVFWPRDRHEVLVHLRGQSVTVFLNILKASQPGCREFRGSITPLLLESGLCRGQSFDWMGSDAFRVPEDVESHVSLSALAFAHLQDIGKP